MIKPINAIAYDRKTLVDLLYSTNDVAYIISKTKEYLQLDNIHRENEQLEREYSFHNGDKAAKGWLTNRQLNCMGECIKTIKNNQLDDAIHEVKDIIHNYGDFSKPIDIVERSVIAELIKQIELIDDKQL